MEVPRAAMDAELKSRNSLTALPSTALPWTALFFQSAIRLNRNLSRRGGGCVCLWYIGGVMEFDRFFKFSQLLLRDEFVLSYSGYVSEDILAVGDTLRERLKDHARTWRLTKATSNTAMAKRKILAVMKRLCCAARFTGTSYSLTNGQRR